jgi:hypothetical protein
MGLMPNFEGNSLDGANLLSGRSICIVQYRFGFSYCFINISFVPKIHLMMFSNVYCVAVSLSYNLTLL